ncbi:MAG: hypothetical protein GQ542_16490 [Desulforhopalus sp.]|nr:hypothetical protein [Desulforhopalus sp.]
MPDGNGRLCCIVAVRWSSGKGKSWPVTADLELCIGESFCGRERQHCPVLGRTTAAYSCLYCFNHKKHAPPEPEWGASKWQAFRGRFH